MSAELIPFFPSATHPALPIAASVLSNLRNLTAPGKGNDIRAEERAALVGVSALLACEKVQSKDLVEKTAQKAASVSPAHFRSALRRARELLASQPADQGGVASPSRRSAARPAIKARTTSTTSASTSSSQSNPIISPSAPSLFSTPKKKFKYSSGVDISGLVKHSPAKGSPLKQSVMLRRHVEHIEALHDQDEDDEAEAELGTPTKVRHVQPELTPRPQPLSTADTRTSKKRKDEDMAAFFALKPGTEGGSTSTINTPVRFRGFAHDPTEGRDRVRRTEEERKVRKVSRRRDWTFSEEVWGGEAVRRRNERVLKELALWGCSIATFLAAPPHGILSRMCVESDRSTSKEESSDNSLASR